MLKRITTISLCVSLTLSSLNADLIRELLNKMPINSLKEDSKVVVEEVVDGIEKISMTAEDKEFVNKKWDDLFKKIENAEETYNNLEVAPESALFKSDKTSLKKDLDKELSEILFLITEDKVALKYIKMIRELNKSIQSEKDKITKYKEQIVFAKNKDEQTTYEKNIETSNQTIQIHQTNIDKIKESLIFNLSSAGINFNAEQVEMLISRVDVDNILELTLVYNNLKIVTEQLGKLMEATKDDIKATKKYYAMFVILSEMIVYTQKQYLNKMENVYLPKISKVISDTESIQIKTKMLMSSNKDENYKATLNNNLRNQSLSFKTATLYKKQLLQQKANVEKALKKSSLDLKITLNTFKTVQISFTLLDIIKESRESFNSLMNIQLPEIIPFENKEMQVEYNKITKEISEKTN